MTQAQEAHLSPETIMTEMKKNGVTHVVWLPDSETNWLYLLMQADPSLHLIAVSREGHAFATAAGLSVGGKTPIILIQNTGLMESGDSLRGWALGMNIPVVLMVGYRGWTRHGVTQDTAAIYTSASSIPLALTIIWWKATRMHRGSQWRLKRRGRSTSRLPCS